MIRRFLTSIFLLTQLTACTVTDYRVPAEEEIPGPTMEPSPTVETVNAPSSYRELLRRSDSAVSERDFDAALALLERAQRIAPDASEIYLRMARVHRKRGDNGLARSTAERGLLYCQSKKACDALRRFLR